MASVGWWYDLHHPFPPAEEDEGGCMPAVSFLISHSDLWLIFLPGGEDHYKPRTQPIGFISLFSFYMASVLLD